MTGNDTTPRPLICSRPGYATALALMASLASPDHAAAQQMLGSEIRAGAGYSDNVTRNLDSLAVSSSWVEAGLNGNFAWSSPRFVASLNADASYMRYSAEEANSEVRGGASASLTADIVDERFLWQVQDVYTQTLLSAAAPDAPGNRQGVNSFSTGPDLYFPLGARTRAFAKGRYGRLDYETQSIDNTRRSATVGIERRISSASTLRISASEARVEFESEATDPRVETRNYSVGLRREAGRSTLDMELGRTSSDYQGESDSSLLARGSFEVRLSPTTTVAFEAGKEYSDSGTFVRDAQIEGVPASISGSTQDSDPLQTTYVRGSWSRDAGRTTFRVYADRSRDRRDVKTFLDMDRYAVIAGGDYRVGARASVGLSLSASRQTLVETDVRTKSRSVGLRFGLQMTSRIRMTAAVDRVSGDFGAAESDYSENRATIQFGYSVRR